MQPLNKQTLSVALALVTLLFAGCSFIPSAPEDNAVLNAADTFETLVARDVVSVLRQVEELAPERTTLGTSLIETSQQSPFAQSLKTELQSAGYAIRTSGDGLDTVPISFDLKEDDAIDSGRSLTYTVSAGDVAVRRTYVSDSAGDITPLGTMQIRGADARNLILDNSIFSTTVGVPANAPANAPATQEPPAETVVPPGKLIVLEDINPGAGVDAPLASTDDLPMLVVPSSKADSKADSIDHSTINSDVTDSSLLESVPPSLPEPSQALIVVESPPYDDGTENVMVLQQSNFADEFAEMGIIREKVLTFSHDSDVIDGKNKASLNAMLDHFNAQSDMLSVIGCALGATNHIGGQEALARDRASRVRDALMDAGVPEESILEEGCWAEEEAIDQRMPPSGVVVTLNRRLG